MTTRTQFTTRLPVPLSVALADRAEANHRSANAELTAILVGTAPPLSGTAPPQDVDKLKAALALCVESLDQLIPHLGKVPADIGLLNDALCAARPLLNQTNPDRMGAPTWAK